MNRDVMAAVQNYQRLQPPEEAEAIGNRKAMVLWQDFQKLLANQMLGEKIQHSNTKNSPTKYGMKPIKQSPLRTNFAKNSQQRTKNEYYQN